MPTSKFLLPAVILSLGFPAACREDPSQSLADYGRTLEEKFPEVRTVSTAALAAKKGAPLLLDVRTGEEFAVSHLPGAVRAEEDAAAQLQRMGVPKEREIVVYCSVGYRSARLARELTAAGFSEVKNLRGSIFAWTNEGRPLVNAWGPTTGTHPYNRKWGRYLERSHWRWQPEGKAADGFVEE